MVVNEDHIGAAIIGMWRMGANYYQIAYHLNTTINYVEIIITGFEVLKQTGKINEHEKRIQRMVKGENKTTTRSAQDTQG